MSSNRLFFIAATTLAAVLTFNSAAQAQQSKPWVAPKDAESVANPVAANPAMLKDVRKLYVSTCAPCHGEKGKGDGPAAVALNPKPADHTSVAVQRQTDGALFWMISTGRNSMPAYKAVLTETQRWQLIDYIRTFAKH